MTKWWIRDLSQGSLTLNLYGVGQHACRFGVRREFDKVEYWPHGCLLCLSLDFSGGLKHFRVNITLQNIRGFLYESVCKVGVKLIAEERGGGRTRGLRRMEKGEQV